MGWNDITSTDKSDSKKSNFLSLKSGTTCQIRTLDDAPFSRYTHWIPQANNGSGTTINCIGKDCPICADVKKRKASGTTQKYGNRKLHAMNVIDRESGEVAILDKGKRCFEALSGIRDMIGDLRDFDVKIRVTGEGTDTSYVAIPMPAKPLNELEKSLEKYNFSEVYPALTSEQVLQLMDGKGFGEVLNSTGDADTTNNDDELPIMDVDFAK